MVAVRGKDSGSEQLKEASEESYTPATAEGTLRRSAQESTPLGLKCAVCTTSCLQVELSQCGVEL